MSLYLKILDEGYDKGQSELFLRGHILPDMSGNIKCGNSLIGTDYQIQGNFDFSNEELFKVNCFDWDSEYTSVFSGGGTMSSGFDVVIGNPPYVLVFNELLKKYMEKEYPEFQRNNDMYIAFIVKGIFLLK